MSWNLMKDGNTTFNYYCYTFVSKHMTLTFKWGLGIFIRHQCHQQLHLNNFIPKTERKGSLWAISWIDSCRPTSIERILRKRRGGFACFIGRKSCSWALISKLPWRPPPKTTFPGPDLHLLRSAHYQSSWKVFFFSTDCWAPSSRSEYFRSMDSGKASFPKSNF